MAFRKLKASRNKAKPARSAARQSQAAEASLSVRIRVAQPLAAQVKRNPAAFKSVLAKMGRALAASASGIHTDLVVSVRPGKARPHVEIKAATAPQVREPTEAKADLERALEDARKRGDKLVAKILRAPDMLSADAFGDLINVSRTAVHDKRQKHEILGLQGAKRGYRFPTWQLDEHGTLFLAGLLPKLFERLGSEWSVYRFLLQVHPELGGEKTALDALKSGETKPVLDAAETIASCDFS